ncbi:DUF4136 domain-containing protein [Algoriphagus sp. A40]|uniref:DUF4136 domain-containing protein n=1 Tax=Algoriphagus sp. A40 TaxID=1945863 RepID=UPI000985CACD|nr:DUF4136 domain-containing protein [Algoriphagus sp. A40]OOG72429.1 hypothetical protein B0E43_15635 [Algoriphagus sp. A40]
MKRKIQIILLFVCLTLVSSCCSVEIFKENTEIPMTRPFQTFVIINKEVGMRGFSEQFIDELVQIQIQETLEKAGMVYDSKKPDLVIRYHSNEDSRQREVVNNSNPYPFWGYRVYDPWMYNPYNSNYNRVSTSSYELLQVILDFIDPSQDKFLMTLTGVTEVSSPKQKQKKVEKTLDSVLRSFLNQKIQPQN